MYDYFCDKLSHAGFPNVSIEIRLLLFVLESILSNLCDLITENNESFLK